MRDARAGSTHKQFPGLDSLRFYAALSVIVAHLTSNFAEFRTRRAEFPLINWLFMDAQSAVSLFFVLSGFLITYLLLNEANHSGGINVGKFYVRRLLRIWPLYYLIALLGFVVIPLSLALPLPLDWLNTRSVLLTLFLLPNLVGPLGPLGHLWSIGLEEQFYLVWPWVVKNRDRLLRVAFGILIIKLAILPVILSFNSDAITNLFMELRVECMAIGGLGAYLYVSNHKVLRYVYSPVGQALGWLGMLALALFDVEVTLPNNLLLSCLFTLFILNLATNPQSWLRYEPRFLKTLGNMSYGIYMYHYPLLYVILYTLQRLGWPEDNFYAVILYTATIGGSLTLAAISYRWFETPFLRLKQRFATNAENPPVNVVNAGN